MTRTNKVFLSSLVFIAFNVYSWSCLGFGMNVEVKSLQFTPNVISDGKTAVSHQGTIYIDYTINGKKRQLKDDDGLATLFLIHRNATTQIINETAQLDSVLPKPYTALFKALDSLEDTYREAAKAVDNGAQYTKYADRVQTVAKKLKAKNPIRIKDLQATGLEALINDSLPNHTYQIHRDETNDSVRGLLDKLFLKGVPASMTAKLVPRCRDLPKMNWKRVTKSFIASSKSQGRRSKAQGATGIK